MLASADAIGSFRCLVDDHYYQCTSIPLQENQNIAFNYSAVPAGPMRLDRMSGGDVLVKRSWHQVRSRPSEIFLIRFPEEGSLDISQDGVRNARIGTGEFVITYGNRPFQAKALGQSGGRYSQVDIVVPSHLLRSLLPEVDLLCGISFKLGSGATIARSMIDDLIASSGTIEPELAGRLAEVGVEAIVSDIRKQLNEVSERPRPKPTDLERVLAYIEANFTVPGLSGDDVARACRISKRHLHNLMASTETTFSEYLWGLRLMQAHDWLKNGEFSGFNISQIAHMCGFQCGSHFSKLYKERFGTSPRSIRKQEFLARLS